MNRQWITRTAAPACLAWVALWWIAGLATSTESLALDRYGGCLAVQREATGWFRLEKLAERWFLITPEGRPFISLGVNHCNPADKRNPKNLKQYAQADGDQERLCRLLETELRNLGFNSGGGYEVPDPFQDSLPFFHPIGYPNEWSYTFDIFDPAVQEQFSERARKSASRFQGNKFMIGYYYIDCGRWDKARVDFYRALPPQAPGKRRYVEFLRQRHGAIAQLNQAYGLQAASFEALLASDLQAVTAKNSALMRDDDDFKAIIAEDINRTMKAAVRSVDAHHLIFGERPVMRNPPLTVIQAMARHVDALALQPVSGEQSRDAVTYPRELLDSYYQVSGKPIIICDYSLSFKTGTIQEADWPTLKNEVTAAAAMSRWFTDAFRSPYIIGIHKCELLTWFKKGPNEKRDFWRQGFLQPDGTPYEILGKTMRETNQAILESLYREAQGPGMFSNEGVAK